MNADKMIPAIGWSWVGMGGLAMFSGFGALGMSFVTGGPEAGFPFELPLFDLLFTHFKLIAVVQIVAGVFTAFSAFMFLRRQLWALIALAIFCVLETVWVVVFGFQWVKLVTSVDAGGQPFAQVFISAMAGMGALTMLSIAAVFLLCLWFLRDPKILAKF